MVFSQIIYILQTIIQEELQKVKKILQKKLDFENIRFPVKIRDIYKILKKNSIRVFVFGYENKEKYSIMCQRNAL